MKEPRIALKWKLLGAAVLLGAWNLGELAGAWYLERRGPQSKISNWLRFAAGASLSSWLLWLAPTPFIAAPVCFLMAAAMSSSPARCSPRR